MLRLKERKKKGRGKPPLLDVESLRRLVGRRDAACDALISNIAGGCCYLMMCSPQLVKMQIKALEQ